MCVWILGLPVWLCVCLYVCVCVCVCVSMCARGCSETQSPVKCSSGIKEPLFTKVVPAGPLNLPLYTHTHTHTHTCRQRNIRAYTVHSLIQTYKEFVGRQTNTHNTHSPPPNHSFLLESGSCTEVNIWMWDVNSGLCKSDTHTHTFIVVCVIQTQLLPSCGVMMFSLPTPQSDWCVWSHPLPV